MTGESWWLVKADRNPLYLVSLHRGFDGLASSAGARWISPLPLPRMAGYRDEYIDLMAGVPQIADDFAASHWSAALGQQRTH